jgi:alpha-beta hydrolase superfamily lysophospholipase
MTHQTAFIKSSDDINVFSQVWKPDQSPDCVICLVHGIGEHSSRYDDWAKRFVSNNIALVAFDKRGHGKSEGKRGVIPSYETLLDDIDILLLQCEKLFPNIPIVLYGHSMGGGEVLSHLNNRSGVYKAVISTSPWLIAQQSPPKFLIPIVGLCKRLFPNLSLKTKLNPDWLSRDSNVGKEYMNDPLVHPMVSFRLFYEAYQRGYSLLNSKSKLNKPLLLLHGSSDLITSYSASQKFAAKAGELCQFHLFEGAFHELQNDFCKDEAFDLILSWVHKNVTPSL